MYKWIMSGLIVVVCLFGVGLLLNNLPAKERPAASSASSAIPDRPVDAAAAEPIYKSNCLSCHGDQLQGGIGPELTKVGSTMSKESIYKQIANGGGGMPKFKGRLSDDEIAAIATWLAAKQ